MTLLEQGADPCSWTGAADAVPGVHLVGGWAEWGAPASRIAEEIAPVDVEVLVVLAGTNDAMIGIPRREPGLGVARSLVGIRRPRSRLRVRPGVTSDGIHPGAGTQAAVGRRVADAVLGLVTGDDVDGGVGG